MSSFDKTAPDITPSATAPEKGPLTPNTWAAHKYTVYSVSANGWADKFIACTAHNNQERTPEALQNALLIAAAPDLLAALKQIMEDLIYYEGPPSHFLLKADAAIAKAEGR